MRKQIKQAMIWALLATFGLAALNLRAAEEEADEDEEEDEEDVEEILVTGSYIRRTNFDLPSPRDVVDAVDLSLAATSDLGEVVFDQTFQIGVNANSAPIEFNSADDQEFQQGSETWANLRGLGTRATLTMMDGHRVPANVNGYGSRTRRAGADLNNLYPGIAVGRLETILDGASALYGASAVSGVINLVPRKDFDGLQVNYEYRQPLENGAPEKRLGILAGAQGERTSVIFALEIRDQERMKGTDRPEYIISSANWTGQLVHPYQERPWSHPGDWMAPIRNTSGELQPPQSHTWPSGFAADPWNARGWGGGAGWIADRYSPSRESMANGVVPSRFEPGDAGGGWFSPLRAPMNGNDVDRHKAGVVRTFVPAHWRQGGFGPMEDQYGDLYTANRADPGCGYAFGGGNDHTPFLPPIGLDDPRRDEQPDGWSEERWLDHYGDSTLTTIFGDSVRNLGYSANQLPGSYLNGFQTGELGGFSAWLGEEIRYAGSGNDCRQAIGDTFDIRERRDQEQAMTYFEHEFNDYVTIHGEVVVSRLDYDTRQYAPRFDDWPTSGTVPYADVVPIAVGSNPGNPFRSFADGTNSFSLLYPDDPTVDPNMFCREVLDGDGNVTSCMGDSYLNYHDANQNGRYDYLQEPGELLVYAQDANGDGIPDRGIRMVDADGAPLLDDNGEQMWQANTAYNRNPRHRVILLSAVEDSDGDGVPDRFDPDTVGNGGVRLFEDARLVGMNLWPKNPHNNNLPWLNDDMTWKDRTRIENFRFRLGTEVSIPETEWIVDADWIWTLVRRTDDRPEGIWPMMNRALRCEGGQYGDTCWNPFSTHWLGTTEEGELQHAYRMESDNSQSPWDPSVGAYASDAINTESEFANAGIVLVQNERSAQMTVLDLVISNGSLFQIWNDTPFGIAAGVHWRRENEELNPDAFALTGVSLGGDELIGLNAGESVNLQDTSEETRAVFVEAQIQPISHPKWGQMEVQIAARYAEFDTKAFLYAHGNSAQYDTVIPKLAMRYQPTSWLAVRGSLTEGFVLPSSSSLFQPGNARNRADLSDYICNNLPELDACLPTLDNTSGVVRDIEIAFAGNPLLGPEISDLWNAGFSLQFLDGDLTFDVDYTTVNFDGRSERLGAGTNLASAGAAFGDFVQHRCGADTLLNYNDPNADRVLGVTDFMDQTPAAELECRRQAAIEYVRDIEASTGIAGAVIERGGVDGLELQRVGEAWVDQGRQWTTSMIYAGRYRFDAADLPFIGGDYGSFEVSLSATQMLELSICRYGDTDGETALLERDDGTFGRNPDDRDHVYAEICVDGAGYRNNGIHYIGAISDLVEVLPATPKWRANMGLRWFYDQHTAQLTVRWHDEVKDTLASWDPVKDQGHGVAGIWINFRQDQEDLTNDDVCVDQDRNPHCRIDSRHYWDLSYTYNRPDVFGLGYVSANVAMRNIFNTMPDAMPSGVGYDVYLDNIMGRQAFFRLTVGF
ncbi:MAG: TonB-dependent receptor [Gammaproteobacteria bacterium]|nr:TonB-dependent receptor [Gammaproteobacteria bacterium]